MLRAILFFLFFPFAGLFAQELHLYNGPEYTGFYHGARGHPFFKTDSLLNGDIFYEGILYKNVLLGYNIADNQVYIRDDLHGFNIRMLNEKISYFIAGGDRFEKLSEVNGASPGFYQLLFDGHIKVYASRIKKLNIPLLAEDPIFFLEDQAYFIAYKNNFHPVSGLRSILAALPGKDEDVKRFIRTEKTDLKKDFEGSLVRIAEYFDRNTKWKETDTLIVQKPAAVKAAAVQIASLEENRVFEFGTSEKPSAKSIVTLTGYIKDSKSGESVIGATVSADSSSSSVMSDQFGYYTLTLSRGHHDIKISSLGMKDARRRIVLNDDGKLDVELSGQVTSLKAVVVVAEKNSNVRSTQMSVDKLTIRTIRQVPVVLGEADVLKVVTTLPGVTSAGEASNGFNVRGGSVDQNLILLNEATIYNPSHLFGLFSAFNPDLIKAVELYKSSIPEKYGGRISSVLDVTVREGNNKKIAGTGGIGPLTSKMTIEGPIHSDKTTFIAGARTTYSNWLLKKLPDERYRNSRASFYDLSLNVNHSINAKNNIYLAGYISNDRFRLNNDTSYKYGNTNWNVKWKHIISNKIYAVFTGGHDQYKYSVQSNDNPVNAFRLGFNISQSHFRTAFSYSPSNNHQVDFGINSIYYHLQPGSYEPNKKESLVTPAKLQTEQALETALYIGDRYSITPDLSINLGIRYSFFNYLGPYNVYEYAPGIPKDTSTITDTSSYGKGKVIKTYHSPEFRISARYNLSDNSSFKISFNTTRQYIHMLSNTTSVSPTDTWKLSDADIRPQEGTQWSAGLYRNFRSNSIETSVEVYYKTMRNVLDYKSGARLIMNQHIAADVISARGKSYGAELMIKKVSGKLNGWISYTYSRTMLKQDDPGAGENINRGEYYPASFDKPHNLNFIGNYRFSHRFSFSGNLVYTTGRPITIPVAIYEVGGAQRVYYSDRNQYRVPDYLRADIAFTMEGNHKVKQRIHNSWSFGFYNVTGRKNPYSVYFRQEDGIVKGYQLSIFGTAIPFVTYNFKF